MELEKHLLLLKRKFGLNFLKPLEEEEISRFEKKFGTLPEELKSLYRITNGIEYETFKIFPLFDKKNFQKTWDNLEACNTSNLTKFKILHDADFLKKFLIFGYTEGMKMLKYDRKDSSIWYENSSGYNKTNLNLIWLIKGMVSEERQREKSKKIMNL